MDISWSTIGHKQPKQYLTNAFNRNKLAQAYIFIGPEGVGKTSLALDLAAHLLKKESRTKLSASDPDFIFIDQAEEIKITQIRDLKQKLSLRSITGGIKIAIVAGVERFNRESANAFLKILEEPTGDVIFFLTTAIPGKLPNTVLSRAQKLYFASNTEEDIQNFLDTKDISTRLKKEISEFSSDRIGFIQKLLDDKEVMREFAEWRQEFLKALEGDLNANLITSSVLAKYESSKLIEMLGFWLILADNLLIDLSRREGFGLKSFVSTIDTSLQDLGRNLNKKLILDNLFLQINRI